MVVIFVVVVVIFVVVVVIFVVVVVIFVVVVVILVGQWSVSQFVGNLSGRPLRVRLIRTQLI